jgi:peroxiredoxin
MRNRTLRRIAAVLTLAAAPMLLAAAGPPKVGEPAPAFSLTTLDKRKVRLEELKGKVVVINLWATWCGPCKSEMPMMHAYYQKHHAQGLEMFGVTSEGAEVRARLKKVARVLAYPLANQILPHYRPIGGAVPSTFVIDRKGILRVAKRGAISEAAFRKTIDPLLAEAP